METLLVVDIFYRRAHRYGGMVLISGEFRVAIPPGVPLHMLVFP
jgi:hypothetical protein